MLRTLIGGGCIAGSASAGSVRRHRRRRRKGVQRRRAQRRDASLDAYEDGTLDMPAELRLHVDGLRRRWGTDRSTSS